MLLLAEMREHHALRLPYRAATHAPPAFQAALKTSDPVATLPPAPPRPKAGLPAASPSRFDLAE